MSLTSSDSSSEFELVDDDREEKNKLDIRREVKLKSLYDLPTKKDDIKNQVKLE